MAGEIKFEKKLVEKLLARYPGSYVIKNNPNYIQGFPDRLFLYKDFWAAFELKAFSGAKVQPNQAHYINELNNMSLAMFVNPENEEEFLHEIQHALRSKR